MLEVYIDGACAPRNPGGTASYGLIIYKHHPFDEAVGAPWETVLTKARIVGSGDQMSNNVAEYSGLIAFFEWADKQPIEKTTTVIKSDSQLLIKQMRGEWPAKRGLYLPYYQRAVDCLAVHIALIRKNPYRFEWIPREENREADKLSKDILLKHDELETTIIDLIGRFELNEAEVKQLQEAEEELEKLNESTRD